MKGLLAVLALLLGPSPAAGGGATPYGRFFLSYDAGALVALGGRENLLDDAVLAGVTASFDVSRYLAVVASVGREQTEVHRGSYGERSLVQYDVGLQGQYPRRLGAETALVPFVGAGLGGRTSDFSDVGGPVDTDLTGYVALGARVAYRFAVVGVTARDLVSASDGPWPTRAGAVRHDLALLASLGVLF